jgi:hypothetical protein
MGLAIAAGASLAIIAGFTETGPNVCSVDILVQQSGGWELVQEVHPCDYMFQVTEYLAE